MTKNLQFMTKADRQVVEEFEAASKRFRAKHLRTPEDAKRLLTEMGVLTKKGKLKKAYRD